jgi:Na+/H+-dicarboxylate symporter
MQLHNKILIGLVAGVAIGLAANLLEIPWLTTALLALEPIGAAFIRLITMIVVPLVGASLLIGTASLGDLRKLGRIGGKTLAFYLVTTAVAVTLGLLLSNLVLPGSRIDPTTRDTLAAEYVEEATEKMELAAAKPSVTETLLEMIPRNPVQAAAEMEMLQLIVFVILFGAALTQVPKRGRDAVLAVAEGINEAMMVLVDWIMMLAPYAVFALIATVVARFGLDLLASLLLYALTVAAGLLLHALGTYGLILRFLVKINPITFFRRIAQAQLVAFSTSSSNATLPVTMETAEENMGISKEVSSFVLPLGATINMDGTALYQAVAVMFIAQIYALPMWIEAQLTIELTATLASIGAAGVPSAGIIILVVVLQSVGIGGTEAAAGIALIFGVDRILDMLRTSVNVTGDLTAASFVARTEGETLEPRKIDHAVRMDPVDRVDTAE